MKNALFALLNKFKYYIFTHKIAVIIIVSILSVSTVATTSAMFLNSESTKSVESTNKATTKEETTTETTTIETTTIPETTTVQPTTKYKVIPKEDLVIGKDTSAEPVQVAPVSNEVVDYTLYEVAGIQYGIDVSKWQNKVGSKYVDIDWAAIKAAGINFVMIKCGGRSIDKTNPVLYEDVCFKRNIEGALANGLQVGVYFFSQALTEQEAIEEASYAISLVQGYKITYPIAFDWEGYNNADYRIYRGYQTLTTTQLTNLSIAFCETIKSAGYTPMHYGNPDSFKNWKFDIDILSSKYKIWLAQYPTSDANKPPYALKSSYNYTYQMWQYGSTNTLPGIPGLSGVVDVNIAYFGYSGTQASTTPIQLNIPNANLTTNVGTPINLLNGVTASNTIGSDVSSSVTVTINSSGNTVSQDVAFNTPGKYVLTYKILDFTGGSKSLNAELTVRGKPTITGIQPNYNDIVGTTYQSLIDKLKIGVTATDYENVSLTTSIVVSITGITDDNFIAGVYPVKYYVSDGKGLTSIDYTSNLTITTE